MASSERWEPKGRRPFRSGPLSLCTPSHGQFPRDGRPCCFLRHSLQWRGSVECGNDAANSKDYCSRCPFRRMRARVGTGDSRGAQGQSRSPGDVASAIRLAQVPTAMFQNDSARKRSPDRMDVEKSALHHLSHIESDKPSSTITPRTVVLFPAPTIPRPPSFSALCRAPT